MNIRFVALFLLVSQLAFGNITVSDVDSASIPKQIPLKKNKISSCQTWTDKEGKHFIIATETRLITTHTAQNASGQYELIRSEGKFEGSKKVNGKMERGEYVGGRMDTLRPAEAEHRLKGLFVYHYVLNNNTATLVWRNTDHNQMECSYRHLSGEYLSKPLVTDIDKDGQAEVWLVYQFLCRDNATTPANIKIVLKRGTKTHTMEGLRVITVGEKSFGGEIVPDKSWSQVPQEYRDYALQLWNKFKDEK
ncbi:MAG: hypothetical protein LBR81_04345 [Prevotellaceae bacterium]|jgi:hypothetical protein|nr:hypothetical protein [Prevotellaceae bacterium]